MNDELTESVGQDHEPQATRMYSMRVAAKMIGVGYPLLLAAAQSGQLKAVPVGSHYRTTIRALNAWVLALERAEIQVPLPEPHPRRIRRG